MIRAREESVSSPAPAPKKPRVGDRVRVHPVRLQCSLCDTNLDRNYSYLECDHQLCGTCTDNIKTPGGITCPMCRTLTTALRQIPLLTEILMDAPRKMACNEVVEGWLGEEKHVNCIPCLKVRVEDLAGENHALKISNTNHLRDLEIRMEEIEVLRRENRRLRGRRVNVSVLETDDSDSDTE